MSKRKGELNPGKIDSGWPYQVVQPGDIGERVRVEEIVDFCRPLSCCRRKQILHADEGAYVLTCFSMKEDAEAFIARFGGEWFDPSERGRGKRLYFWEARCTRYRHLVAK